MIKSMTGYGRGKLEENNREYEIEIKSVNHKYSDISIKIPRAISYLEDKVKKEVLNHISRGKIDVYITFINNSAEARDIKINTEIAKVYINELKNLAKETQIVDNISVTEISKFPDVLTIQNNDQDEELLWNELKKCLTLAIDNFIAMRKQEGEKIEHDLKTRIYEVSEKIDEIATYSTGLVEEYIVKLEQRIKEILKTDIVDQTRLAQEVVIYSDKISIEEELTRLRSHISQFIELLNKEGAVRKEIRLYYSRNES
ncbi:MAG: YicC family protein [Clostridia bacterium]